ncbi:TPA: hypothetical protein QH991_005317, partial [Escherichia coli]|nr:hypothetical protein [Escherichia coli]
LLLFKPNTIYMTKGSSKWGFVRDYAFQLLMKMFSSNTKFVVHLKGGNYDSFYESSTELLKKCIVNFLKNCDSIIVLGPSLIKMYDFCPDIKSKIRVVFNALPQDTVNNYVKENTNTVNVVFLSNLIISKGYLDVLQASLEV